MNTLSKGKSTKAILKLLRILINVSQSNFGDLNLDDDCIRDIADVITAESHVEGYVDDGAESAAQHEQEDELVDINPGAAAAS